jgi:ABC-2 type transport system ATP-binding protein
MDAQTAAIRITGLAKRYGSVTAVENLSLEVRPGRIFGFLGPNGSGKSTTIGCLTGMLDPTAGKIEILGQKFDAENAAIKRRIGVMPETLGLFDPALRPRISGLRGAHVRARRSHHAQTRDRTAGRAGTDRTSGKRWPNTAPACASGWPSPRR